MTKLMDFTTASSHDWIIKRSQCQGQFQICPPQDHRHQRLQRQCFVSHDTAQAPSCRTGQKKKKKKRRKKVSSLKALDTQAVSAVRLGMTGCHNLISNGSRVSIGSTLNGPEHRF